MRSQRLHTGLDSLVKGERMSITKGIIGAIVGVLIFWGGVWAGHVMADQADKAKCPQEDSCLIDYSGERWVITPTTK